MKTFKTFVLATVLVAVPSLSFAMGCSGFDHSKQAQSCVAGATWDAATGACVPGTSS